MFNGLIMVNSFVFAGIVVVLLWVLIMIIFLAVSKRQPNTASQIRSIEELLNEDDIKANNG